jgi:predicted molibdopterin-dependent oxidoreductase YjgC
MQFDLVLTTCPFCGTGCNFYLQVLDGQIIDVVPCKTHPISEGQLCILGRNASRFVNNKDRLTSPLLRKGDGFVPIGWRIARGPKPWVSYRVPSAPTRRTIWS